MSTKNLARTIIEGGRARYNKWQRAASHATERAVTRAHLVHAVRQEDGFEALAIGVRPKVYKGFADKLGPPRRWLRSHVGRPWNKVRSEMFARFDPRTLAGQHIVFDHLLQEVNAGHDLARGFWRSDFIVDAHGILREAKLRRKRRRVDNDKVWRSEEEVEHWARKRRVGGHDETLYWYAPAGRCNECRGHECCCPCADGKPVHGAHLHYRQGQRLSTDEVVFWNSLREETQNRYRHSRS